MVAFLYYPFYLVRFWYFDILWGLVNFSASFNRYLISLLSLDLLIKTFFKPLKNEYRQGLVMFSILFGIFIKTFLIIFLLLIMLLIMLIELMVIVLVSFVPILLIIVVLGSDSPIMYR